MTPRSRLSQLALSLASALAGGDPPAEVGALADADDAGIVEALERLARRLITAHETCAARLTERTQQLELVLGILRDRDRTAAEQSEWDFATDLQTSGLPNDFPPYPERDDFDVYAGMVTAQEVGGDLYDFFLLSPQRFAFCVADACGKGLPAAIFITLTRTLLRAAAQRLATPAECLRTVNAMLCVDNPGSMFTTAFFGILDTSSGDLHYANAGHNPPFVLRADGRAQAVPSQRRIPLGILESAAYDTGTLRLQPGESIVCYSDGVTEAMQQDGEFYGEQRLLAALQDKVGQGPQDITLHVVAEVDRFIGTTPMADDITVLTVLYRGAPG